MRVETIHTFVVLSIALLAVRLHGSERLARAWIQAHATVDPCTFSGKIGEWKCQKAFGSLDQLPPGEVPIPCQKLMRREDGDPQCRGPPKGKKSCTVKGRVLFLQRLLQPEIWEVGERDLIVAFTYCIQYLGHREPVAPLSSSTALVQNYLYPPSGRSVHRTVTRTGKRLEEIHTRANQMTEGMK